MAREKEACECETGDRVWAHEIGVGLTVGCQTYEVDEDEMPGCGESERVRMAVVGRRLSRDTGGRERGPAERWPAKGTAGGGRAEA